MKKELLLSIESKNPNHAYLLLGSAVLQDEFIGEFIDSLQIKNVDLLFIDTSEKIKIDKIREFQHNIHLKPHSSKYKIAIIKNAENLTDESSNALLKTLEEPPAKSIIILTAKNEERILSTIGSRCRKIKIPNVIISDIDPEDAKIYSSIKGMSVKDKFLLASERAKSDSLDKWFDDWQIFLRTDLLKGIACSKIIKKIQNAKLNIRKNINIRLMLENLFLEL